jgi:hypothetical protein
MKKKIGSVTNYIYILNYIYLSTYLSINGSTAFVDPVRLFSFLILYTVGRLLGWVISPSQDIHARNRIRTHNPSVRAG